MLTTGLGTLRLTANVLPALREGTRDILERLAEEVGATAHLVIAEGDEALAVSVVEPRHTTFHVAYRTGSRTPLGVGALGKALAAAPRGERRALRERGRADPRRQGRRRRPARPRRPLGRSRRGHPRGHGHLAPGRPFVQAAADEMMRSFGPAAAAG